ncbi:MAG: hypothetical protein ACXVEB_17830, partial [Bacteroidia bacterium]
MKNIYLLLCVLTLSVKTFSQQQDGYWDSERKTEEFIPLASGYRTWHRVSIPIGTTQIIFRISFLSNSGELRTTLASTLSSIPSASAQGASSVITLLNELGGSNKGQFHIFESKNDADTYLNTGKAINSCYNSVSEIPSEKNYLTIENGACLNANTRYLYFGFTNQNYMDEEQVAIEVMPWIDNKASKGWTKEIKENIYNECIKKATDITKAEEMCQCIVDKLQNNYKVQDIQNMSSGEQEKTMQDIGEECLKITGEDKNQEDKQRNEAKE